MAIPRSEFRLSGDVGSVVFHSSFRFGQYTLRRMSSEARFADGDWQFEIAWRDEAWILASNARAANLTAVNGVAVRGPYRMKTGDVVEVLGRSSGKRAMRLNFSCDTVASVDAHLIGRKSVAGMPAATTSTLSHPAKAAVSVASWDVPALSAGLTKEEQDLQSLLVAGWKSFRSEIDLTEAVQKTNWDSKRVLACARDARFNHPEIFYLKSTAMKCRYSNRPDGGMTRFCMTGIEYAFLSNEYERHKRELDAAVADAMMTINGVSDDVTKALLLHDYLVRACEYDLVARDAHDGSCVARTVYSALVRRQAVCEGYTMAYRYLLNAAGIVSEEVHGVGLSHVWNYVRINDNWYHVDVTWDDPVCRGVKPTTARVHHENFLMSDKRARETGHVAWDVAGLPPATDCLYDGRVWS